jgi:hypothetical protein
MNWMDIMDLIPVITSVAVICLAIVMISTSRTLIQIENRLSSCEAELAAMRELVGIRAPSTHPAGSKLRDRS